jgi:hypothetical protein
MGGSPIFLTAEKLAAELGIGRYPQWCVVLDGVVRAAVLELRTSLINGMIRFSALTPAAV